MRSQSSQGDIQSGADGHGPGAGVTSDHEEIVHIKEDLADVQILLVLGIFAALAGLIVVWMLFGKRCIPFRAMRVHTEKMAGGFGDDGPLRAAWERAKAAIPLSWGSGSRRSWSDFSAERGLLGHERADSGEVDVDVNMDHTQFSIDDEAR